MYDGRQNLSRRISNNFNYGEEFDLEFEEWVWFQEEQAK